MVDYFCEDLVKDFAFTVTDLHPIHTVRILRTVFGVGSTHPSWYREVGETVDHQDFY